MQTTKIEWCDAVWNVVTGCSKVSAGCKNCYAETIAKRFWGDRKFTDVQLHPERLQQPSKLKKASRIFVNSMSDLFHKDVPFEFIDKVFEKMIINDKHTYLILTKRPERMLEYVSKSEEIFNYYSCNHIWMGVSVENQKAADERIPLLLQVPFGKRFLSCEPLLEEVVFTFTSIQSGCCDNLNQGYLSTTKPVHCHKCKNKRNVLSKIDWVIVGGESGLNARPISYEWVDLINYQCQHEEIPFFFKQWGEWIPEGQIDRTNPNHYPRFTKANIGEWVDGKFVEGKYTGNGECYYRLGKKNTGRLLAGKEWNEFPKGMG